MSLLEFDMILYIEYPKDMTELLDLNNDVSEVLDKKINVQIFWKKQGNPAICYNMDDFDDIMLNDIRQRDKYAMTTHLEPKKKNSLK